MPKWISINEAARKYGVEAEDIRIWAEMKEIAISSIENTFTVDDESIQEFLSQHQVTPTREYISSLFNLYSNQWKISELYLEIVNLQKKEIQRQEEEISQLNKLLEMIEEHDRILEDSYHKLYMSLEQPPTNCRIKKLWKKMIHQLLSINHHA